MRPLERQEEVYDAIISLQHIVVEVSGAPVRKVSKLVDSLKQSLANEYPTMFHKASAMKAAADEVRELFVGYGLQRFAKSPSGNLMRAYIRLQQALEDYAISLGWRP